MTEMVKVSHIGSISGTLHPVLFFHPTYYYPLNVTQFDYHSIEDQFSISQQNVPMNVCVFVSVKARVAPWMA